MNGFASMKQKEGKMYLAGDIGGTKARLVLYSGKKNPRIIREAVLVCGDYSSINNLLGFFLAKERVTAACFAMAGPVLGGRGKLTNLDWSFSASSLKKKLRVSAVFVINDLLANALGVEQLASKDFFALQKGDSPRRSNYALISPGTGLGEAVKFWTGKKYEPISCEGGHADFAPQNAGEIELLKFLQDKYGHVSYERVLSGAGLADIYRMLSGNHLLPQEIATRALNNRDAQSSQAVDLFLSVLGAEASNTVLKFMALSGIYVGGGIVPKILPLLKNGLFIKAFTNKGRFSDLLHRVPVKIILNDGCALFGAMRYLAENL